MLGIRFFYYRKLDSGHQSYYLILLPSTKQLVFLLTRYSNLPHVAMIPRFEQPRIISFQINLLPLLS